MWLVFPGIWEADPVLGSAGVLAHQGGWDEALLVITPVALFAGLFWAASRRAARRHADPPSADPPSADPASADPTGRP
jgi:hypothetical protein